MRKKTVVLDVSVTVKIHRAFHLYQQFLSYHSYHKLILDFYCSHWLNYVDMKSSRTWVSLLHSKSTYSLTWSQCQLLKGGLGLRQRPFGRSAIFYVHKQHRSLCLSAKVKHDFNIIVNVLQEMNQVNVTQISAGWSLKVDPSSPSV